MGWGLELGYAEITANATRASGSLGDVSGLSVTVDIGARPIRVEFGASAVFNNAANGGVGIHIIEDSTDLGNVTGSLINSANAVTTAVAAVRRTPSAGSHTYKVQMKVNSIGTATIVAGTGGSGGNSPAYIQVIEL